MANDTDAPIHAPTDFSLDFAWGRGFITRRQHTLRYGQLDVVQTEIPDLRPSRTVLSHADDFRATRTVLCNLGASTTLSSLNEWVGDTARRVPYADSASLDVRDGALRLRLKVRAFGQPVELLSPVLVSGGLDDPSELEIIALPGWVFGALPAASFCTVTRFITDAVAACEPAIVHSFARLQSAPSHSLRLPLVRLLAAVSFVPEGWRLPTTGDVQIDGLFAHNDRLQLRATHTGFSRAAALAGFETTARRIAQPELASLAAEVPAAIWDAIARGRAADALDTLDRLARTNSVAAGLLAECAAATGDDIQMSDESMLATLPLEQVLQHRLRSRWSGGPGSDLADVLRDIAEFADAAEDDTLLELSRQAHADASRSASPATPVSSEHGATNAGEERPSASVLRSRLEVIRQRIAEFEDSGSRAAVVADVPYASTDAIETDDRAEQPQPETHAPAATAPHAPAESPAMPDTSDGSSEMLHERLERARAAGNVAEQVDILRRLAAVAPSPDGRADYLARAGVLAYFDLEDDSLSLQLLDEAVAQDSTVLERHFEAVSAWETLCRANDRSDALLAVHDLRIKGATDASMQAVHRLVKAGFLMHELGDPLAAAAEAELVLARDPVHVPALQLLAEALTAAGEPEQAWPVWLRLLQPGVLDDVERPGVLEQAAWFATDFGRAEALELWWAVLETSPSNLVAYQQLRRLTEGQPTRRWLVVEQECAATLGVERSGVLRTLMQLNWGSLPESLQIHLQTLTAELLELRLDHNERLAWPWRAVLESLLRAPAVHPAAWATAARLAMAAQWDELSEALWDGVAVWAIDPDLLALARNRGIAPASEHTSSTPTITHEIPMAAPSDQWPATPSKRATPVRAGATITYDAPMPERLADQPLDPARRADQARQAGGTETIVHEVPMARPPADWEVVDTNDVETATQADISSTDAPGHRRPATITHDVPMARRSNDWEAAPTDQTTDVIADTGADTAPVAPTSPPRATGSPSLAGAETARALAASIPSARIDQARPAPSAAAVSADSNDGSFNKELARLDAVAAVDRTAALRDLERVLRTTRAPAERVELLMRKGEWLVALGRGEEALQPLKGAFIYQAQNPNLRALLALAFAASGKTNDARSHARAALTRADALRFDPHALRRLAGLGD